MSHPTPYLKGNNEPCAACELRRELQDTRQILRDPIPCNVCDGKGYLPLTAAEIVRRTVVEVQRLRYWAEFDRRNQLPQRPRHPATNIGA